MSRALTHERIIDVAMALADEEGFEAVTLRRIASEIGVHVTSLYNHVETRDAVTDGMVERLVAEAELPLEPLGWEAWVRAFFHRISSVATAHPGAFAALQHRPVQGESASQSFEVALEAFARAGLDPAGSYAAVKTTTMTALAVGVERALEATGQMVSTDVEALPLDRFPQIRLIADVADNEGAYSFALEALVAGIRSQLRRNKASRRATT